MSTQENQDNIVGRGNEHGAQLFRDWFESLSLAEDSDRETAYVYVMGSMAELLQVFDFHTVFPEINSLQTAVRQEAQTYIGEAEDAGYSPDICGYVKADVGVQRKNGSHPMGHIPRPSLALATNACNTYIKWAEIWERMYDIPIYVLDIPGSRTSYRGVEVNDEKFQRDVDYVEHQIRELIELCEEVTEKEFDIDKLREGLRHTNVMSRAYRKTIRLNKNKPALFNALTDGTIYLGVANAFRAREQGATYFEELLEEMEYKEKNGIGTVVDEKHRLIFVGVPCYPIFRKFFELFSDWGGVFVNSTYLWFASGGLNLAYDYDVDRPIRSLAEGVLRSVSYAMDGMFFQDRELLEMTDEFHADGIVFHPIKSCRTVSTGLADTRRSVMEKGDVRTLFIESDMMDKRVVSEAQLKNRVDAFFEGLESEKMTAEV